MATGLSVDDDVARPDLPLPDYDDAPIGSLQHRIRMLGASQLGTLFARTRRRTATAPRGEEGVSSYADYEGHRTRALYSAPTRVEIVDGALKGRTFKTPAGAARAVVRHYKLSVDDNHNCWSFWRIDNRSGRRVRLLSIRPTATDDWVRRGISARQRGL